MKGIALFGSAAVILLTIGCTGKSELVSGGETPPPTILSFVAEPPTIDFGAPVALSWKTRGAERVILTEGDEVVLDSNTEASGLLERSPSSSVTYTLMIEGGEQEASQTLRIEVRPAILEFRADGAGPFAAGDDLELRWKTGAARELLLGSGDDVLQAIPAASIEAGSLQVQVPVDGRFSLTARSGDLEVVETLQVELAVAPPRIVALEAWPSRVAPGRTFELHWQTEDAVEVELSLDDVPVGGALDPAGGTIEQQLAADGRYRLLARNAAGDTVEQSLLVPVGAPIIVSFAPGQRTVAAGAGISLIWEVEGGESIHLEGPGGTELPGCDSADIRRVGAGRCELTAPSSLGDYVYTLSVGDGVSTVQAETLLRVVDGPTIFSFTASADSIDLSQPVTLRWSTDRDETGAAPSLSLQDDRGALYDLQDADPLEGSLTIVPEAIGSFTFILTASTEAITRPSASVTVQVLPLPQGQLLATPQPYDPLVDESVELAWSVEGALSFELWELDEEGAPIGSPLASASSLEGADAGSVQVDPAATTTYRLEFRNGNGTSGAVERIVEVLEVEIVSFTATPNLLVENGITHLDWQTQRAVQVSLDLDSDLSISTAKLPFLDLLESPDSARLSHAGDLCGRTSGSDFDIGCPVLEFPEGFAFPYDGETYQKARVFVDGMLQFDLERTNATLPISRDYLPIPTGGAATTGWTTMLAPFWTNLNFPNTDAAAGIYYELRDDPGRGRHLVIEWARAKFPAAKKGQQTCEISIGVELVLWEDGGFDFRYDISDMVEPVCNGSVASIGFQYTGGTEGTQFVFDSAVVEGLQSRSFAVRPIQFGASGGVDVPIPTTRTFTLTAVGARDRVKTQTIEVRAVPPPRLQAVFVEPALPIAGLPAAIGWQSQWLDSLEVLGPDGAVVCPASGNALPNGGCTIRQDEPGTYDYLVVGTGPTGDRAQMPVAVAFLAPLEIDSFSVSPPPRRSATTSRWS